MYFMYKYIYLLRDGNAEFPVTTTPAPQAGCPTSNTDMTLRADGCACREETTSR